MEGPRSRRLQAVLLSHPAVVDCAVTVRSPVAGTGPALVAYVVLHTRVGADEVRAFLTEHASEDLQAVTVVPVSSLPLTAQGDVDIPRLEQHEIADDALAAHWEAVLGRSSEVAEAAALIHDHPRFRRRLHLWDLLPSDVPHEKPRAVEHTSSIDVTAAVVATRPAVSAGGELSATHGPETPIIDWLVRAAATDQGVTYVEADGVECHQSYRELLAEATRVLNGLRSGGVAAGDRVLIQCNGLRNFLETFWGCVLGGIIPVPLAVPSRFDTASGQLDSLRAACGVLAGPIVVTERATLESVTRATATLTPAPRVLATEDLRADGPLSDERPGLDTLALLMLTSGSTGTPKAVMLTHRNLWSRTVASRQMNGFSRDDVSLNWMPLDHVAGLIYFHLRDVFGACRQVHVATSFVLQEPLRWLDCLERYRATVTFAPNFAYGLVNDRLAHVDDRRWDLSSVRLVLNGAEAIVARTARRFLRLLAPHALPATALHPAWGMSETSSGVTYSDVFTLDRTSDEDAFVEVGRPIPGLTLRIVDSSGKVVDEGTIGQLQVRGPMVTRGYYQAPNITREAFTDDGWFITGDLGMLRDGRLTITGREKDVIIINSVNYHCHTIEAAIEELEGVEPSYTAACAVRRDGADTDQLAVFFHPRVDDDPQMATLLDNIRTTLTRRIGLAADYIVAVDSGDIPKTSLGKIQRAELARRFVAGDFDEALKRSDVLAANTRTLPDWFFRSVWHKRRATEPAGAPASERVLLFRDGCGLAAQIQRQCDASGATCVAVDAGPEFRRESDGNFVINPASADDYARLVAELCGNGGPPPHIIHLWGYREYRGEASLQALESEQLFGALSVIRLVSALSSVGTPPPIRLLVIGNDVHRVLESDVVAYEKAAVLGVVSSLPQEHPWLQCRHVDIDGCDLASAAAVVRSELQALDSDRIVAYRQGQRYVRGLERAAFAGSERQTSIFRPREFYLVTGGAGGIGEHVCTMLAEHFQSHLLLIGRRERDAGATALVAQLQRVGSGADYVAADVCDYARVSEVVAAYEERWQRPLAGVIHLAGLYEEGPLVEQQAARFFEVLRPKTAGTVILHRLLSARGRGFMVSASSVAGFFGGANVGVYASANAFQEAFASHYIGRDAVAHYCFAWSNWDGVGQSRDHQLKDAAGARGYLPIAPALGVRSLLVGTAFRAPMLLVGLDGTHRFVRRHVATEAEPLERLTLFYTAGSRSAPDWGGVEVRDRFGTTSRPEAVRLLAMPRGPDGAIDRAALAGYWGGTRARGGASAPRTDVERRLADLWARTLGVTEVSLDNSFFDAGGDSLHALRLLGRIRETFGVDLPVRAIFDANTLQDLARLIEQRLVMREEDNGVPGVLTHDSDVGNLLDGIDDLSEEDIDRLLQQLDVRQEPA